MNSNTALKEIHLAVVDKVAERCAVEGNTRAVVEIGNDIIAYGQEWTKAIGDDGRISEEEKAKIHARFCEILDKRVPVIDGAAVDLVYNGIDGIAAKFLGWFGVRWTGLKGYLNKWFGLDL